MRQNARMLSGQMGAFRPKGKLRSQEKSGAQSTGAQSTGARPPKGSLYGCAAAGILALTQIFAPSVSAGEWDLGAEVAGEVRYFPHDPLFAGQLDHWQPSLFIQPDIRWETDDRKHQLAVIPYFRLDSQDDERTHFDLREAYYRFNSDNSWSITAGVAKVFWGRTESRHLVDIINQTDGVEDIDEEDKLGQPMVNLSILNDWGVLDFFVMSGFRDRTFPGRDGRLRVGQVVDTQDPIFERNWRRGAVDYAARYSHYIGEWDFGVSVFHGTSREARFALSGDGQSLRPVYDKITQGSIDLQYTKEAWLWKLEAIVREGHGDTFFASVAGFEYTLYQVLGAADLGLLVEYQYDGRDEGFVQESFGLTTAAPIIVGNNDVFAGARFAFNDTQDTAILAGLSVDTDDQSTGIFIEAERRIGENWTAELETRLFVNVDGQNTIAAFRDDDFMTLRLTRYF